jgi:hypothetical protein
VVTTAPAPEIAPELLDLGEWDPFELAQVIFAVLALAAQLVDHTLFDYQLEFGERFTESILINDGEELTLLQARQSGKTEIVAAVLASLMILLPRLAKVKKFAKLLGMYKNGVMIGVFAPTDEQSATLFSRIKGALETESAEEILEDAEIDDKLKKDGVKTILLKNCKSFVRSQTAHPRANIESKSYHIIVVDEAQDADETKVRKSVHPMGAFYNATRLKLGSASRTKGDFYRAIKKNIRKQNRPGATKKNHFEYDWKRCAANNPRYAAYIETEKESLGEESEEFLLSYCCKWLLDRGMFISEQLFEALSDKRMTIVQRHHTSPLVAGLDVARKMDSTVLTILWVDWNHPDPKTGLFDSRVLNWLEIQGDPGGKWHSRYNQICDFLENYSVTQMAVDGQGMGDVVAEDLQVMLPHIKVHCLSSDPKDQSMRWKHLLALQQHGMIGWPGHKDSKRYRVLNRFQQQMLDLEKIYKGKYLLAAAPDTADAHDDYCDSLALAAWLPKEDYMPTVQVIHENPFFARRSRSGF